MMSTRKRSPAKKPHNLHELAQWCELALGYLGELMISDDKSELRHPEALSQAVVQELIGHLVYLGMVDEAAILPPPAKCKTPRQAINAIGRIKQSLDRVFEEQDGVHLNPAASPPKKPRKRGGKVTTNLRDDANIDKAWKSGRYRSHKELASGLSRPLVEVKAALERQRKRRDKSKSALE